MSSGTLSVCIPSYNGATTIRRALDSVLAQTIYDPSVVDIVLTDDDSPDGTADIVEAEYSDAVRLIRNPQRLGLTGNWQKALSSGTGEIRALLHMDDWYVPTALERVLEHFDRDPKTVMVALGQTHYYGERIVEFDVPPDELGACSGREYFRRRMSMTHCPAPSMAFFRASALDRLDVWYDGSFRYCPELDLYLRLALEFPDGIFVREPDRLVCRGGSEDQFSFQNPSYRIHDFCRVQNRHLARLSRPDDRQDSVRSCSEVVAGDLYATMRLRGTRQLKALVDDAEVRRWFGANAHRVGRAFAGHGARKAGRWFGQGGAAA